MSLVPHKNRLLFICITVFLDAVSVGLVLPVMPGLIREVSTVSLSEASRLSGWLFAAYSAGQILCGPAMGSLSDAFGRRPLLLISIAALFFDYTIMACATQTWHLFVGRIIAGVFGACGLVAIAYAADVSPKEKRSASFGLVGSAFGFGFIAGPAIGGVLGLFGNRVPFFAAAGLSLASFVYGYYFLSETLPADKRQKFSRGSATPMRGLDVFAHHRQLIPLVSVFFAYIFSQAVAPAVWAFWGVAKFGWSEAIIGLTLFTYGVVVALSQAIGTERAVRHLGEPRVVEFGLIVAAVTCVGLAFSGSLAIVLMLLVLQGPEFLVLPVLNSMMSKVVSEDGQGALQGALSSINALAMLFGTIVFTQVFAWANRPGAELQSADAPFWLAALFLLGTYLLFRVCGRGGSSS